MVNGGVDIMDGRHKSPVNLNNLVGQKFGKLTVIERAGSTKNDNATWLCKCDCGGQTVAMGTSLKRGETISCGCFNTIPVARKALYEDMTVDGISIPLVTKKVRNDSQTGIKGITERVRKGRTRYEVYVYDPATKKRRYVGSSADLEKAIQIKQAAEEKYLLPLLQKWEDQSCD